MPETLVRCLALAVIRRALIDCRNPRYRRAVLAWLEGEEGELWIDAAGLDKQFLIKRLREVV
jgi:hypothetical protein